MFSSKFLDRSIYWYRFTVTYFLRVTCQALKSPHFIDYSNAIDNWH
jgi:hypothetical protein